LASPRNDGFSIALRGLLLEFVHPELLPARVVICPAEERLAMSDSYIIEVGSETAGIVVRNPEGFCFFAASHRFNALEGQLFRNAREAEGTAVRLANGDLELAA
jgi:hypothetical protein